MKLAKTQRGMTLIGWLLVLGLIGYFVLMVMRLAPGYLEYMNVSKTIESLKSEDGIANMPVPEIRALIQKRFNVNDVISITKKDVQITRKQGRLAIGVDYEVRKPMFGNIDIVTRFNKQVEVMMH
jgi:hypothetical protein